MSPEKVKVLHFCEKKYLSTKKQHMGKIALLITLHKFSRNLKEIMLAKSQHNLKKIKIGLLVVDFVKLMKNKFRLKIT